jgi:serine protease Do
VLQADTKNVPALEIGSSDAVEEGSRVCVIGSPLGLEGSVSDGIVSAKRDADGLKVLQISAPISPGSSGSPVIDASGSRCFRRAIFSGSIGAPSL